MIISTIFVSIFFWRIVNLNLEQYTLFENVRGGNKNAVLSLTISSDIIHSHFAYKLWANFIFLFFLIAGKFSFDKFHKIPIKLGTRRK